jgi:tetratricopeptide (TPR) repeat protein
MKPLALDNDSNYAFIKYNAGIAHIQAAEKENLSKAIQYFGELTTSSYEDKNSVYQILSTLYLQIGDTANYVRTLEEAVEKFPGETYYINFLIEHLLKTNQSDKAVAYLERAIANDPSFANYYFILGYVKEGLGLKDEAIEQYDKAIAINPEYVEAIFGKGLNLYNRAVEADNKASEIQDYKLYQQERQKVDEMIMAALPYFEKVLELKPEDDVNLRTLKGIYYRFSSKDKEFERKYNDMDKRMKELGY